MFPTLRDTFFIIGALIAAAASFGYAGYRLWRWQQPPSPVVRGEVMRDCNLHRGPCEASFPGGGRIRLSITPRPITPITALRVEVQLVGLAADVVRIDLGSPVMFMGHNRQTLAGRTDTLFVGQTMLPACARGPMSWQLTVTAQTRRGPLGAQFDFKSITGRRQRV